MIFNKFIDIIMKYKNYFIFFKILIPVLFLCILSKTVIVQLNPIYNSDFWLIINVFVIIFIIAVALTHYFHFKKLNKLKNVYDRRIDTRRKNNMTFSENDKRLNYDRRTEKKKETLKESTQNIFDKIDDLSNKLLHYEHELESSQKIWMATVDSISDMVFIVDNEYNIIKANKAFISQLGLNFEDLNEKKCYQIIHSLESPHPLCNQLQQEKNEEISYNKELGGWTSIVSNILCDHENKKIGIIHVCRNINYIKDQQDQIENYNKKLYLLNEKLRAISEAAYDAVVVTNHQGLIEFWNPAAERIFGYKAEEVIGKDPHLIIAQESDYKKYKKSFPKFQKTGKSRVIGNVVHFKATRKDGVIIDISISLSTVDTSDGFLTVAIIRDNNDKTFL